MKKETPIWLQNFKKFLRDNNLDDKVPDIVKNYFQGYIDKISKLRKEISILEEEKRKLLKTLEEYSNERAKAIYELEVRSSVSEPMF